jgi:hypothetical protein
MVNANAQNTNELNVSGMCMCYNEMQKNKVLEAIKSKKNQVVERLYLSDCINGNDYGSSNRSWTSQELEEIYSSLKEIKRIEEIRINFKLDSIPNQGDTILMNVLNGLPMVKRAYLWFEGEMGQHNIQFLKNYFVEGPLTLKVDQKVVIQNYFTINKKLKWDGISGLSFPNLDTLIVENFTSSYLHPTFGNGMDSLKVLIFKNHSSKGLESNYFFGGFSSSIGNLKELETFYFEGHYKLLHFRLPKSFGNLVKLKNLVFLEARASFPNTISHLSKLEKVALTGSSGVKIGLNTNFLKLEKLDSMVVYNRKLKLFSSFKRLKKLKTIQIGRVRKFPNGLTKLRELTKIEVEGEKSTIVIPRSISNLTKLKEIRLIRVKKMKYSLGTLNNLEILHIKKASFSKMTKKIGCFPVLKEVIFTAPLLEELPTDFFHSPKLEKLDLHIGMVTDWANMDSTLSKLFYLKIKTLSKQLPKPLAQCKNLDSLLLIYNGNVLPKDIYEVKSLSYLDLNTPYLLNLSDSLNELTKIKVFYLYSDSLRHLSSTLKLKALEYISLHTPGNRTFPRFLFNSTYLKHIIIGCSVDSLEQACEIPIYQGLKWSFWGNYTLKDIPECFRGKSAIYGVVGRKIDSDGFPTDEYSFPLFRNGRFHSLNQTLFSY